MNSIKTLDCLTIISMIRGKEITWKQAETELERARRFSACDFIGNRLTDDELKGK